MTNERRAVSVAEAEIAAAKAVAEQARLAVETAQLNLERMTVRAPIAGRVLSLEARPGQRLSGNNRLTSANPPVEQGASAVVGLYDPAMLQVRVDVRLEDVPQVQVGQPATIRNGSLVATHHGYRVFCHNPCGHSKEYFASEGRHRCSSRRDQARDAGQGHIPGTSITGR